MDNIFPLPLILLVLLFLALVSFFFSASETSIIGLSKIRLHHMLAQGVKRAKHIQQLSGNLDKFIIAILVGNNLVNIAISAIVTAVFVRLFGYNWGVVLSTFATTLFLLIFCEITPKMLAIKHTEKVALFAAPLMERLVKILRPVVSFFTGVSNLILRALKISPAKRSALVTEEELRTMIEVGKDEGVLTDEERKMLHRIFEFGDTKVVDVMVPKEKMVCVDIKTSADDLLNVLAEEGHSRLPVYAGGRDNVIGVIYARDLLYILRDKGLFVLADIIHKAYYIPAAMRVNEVLKKFQVAKVQIAIVVDEHNKTVGVVTLEDLIEEIVGEIEEEHGRA